MKHLVPQICLVLALWVGNASPQGAAGNPAGNTGAAKNSADAGTGPATATRPVPDASTTSTSSSSNPGDPLLDVPPLPRGKVSFIGGTVSKIDSIRKRVTLAPFGSHTSMKVAFDERTHIYRDGVETTQAGIHKGDRVYMDTMLDSPRVFARNIRVITQTTPADAQGQVTTYAVRRGLMTVHDQLSGQAVTFNVTPQTAIKDQKDKPGSTDELRPGTLVSVRFYPNLGRRAEAGEVSVLAVPGTAFTFVGKIVHLDLRSGVLAVDNQSDDKTYDIVFDAASSPVKDDLRVGKEVTVIATFTGTGYKASSISLNQ